MKLTVHKTGPKITLKKVFLIENGIRFTTWRKHIWQTCERSDLGTLLSHGFCICVFHRFDVWLHMWSSSFSRWVAICFDPLFLLVLSCQSIFYVRIIIHNVHTYIVTLKTIEDYISHLQQLFCVHTMELKPHCFKNNNNTLNAAILHRSLKSIFPCCRWCRGPFCGLTDNRSTL